MKQLSLAGEKGFTFIELLVVVLLLGILVLAALPNYFGAEGQARSKVDQANVRAINAALALYKFNNNGNCPTVLTFPAFLIDPIYFPDGTPVDPWDADGTPNGDDYEASYSVALCRVQMSGVGLPDHRATSGTGNGHD